MGDASVSGTKCLEEVAPDGAEVAGLKHRAKVSDEGAGAVICLKAAAIEMREEKEGSVTPMRVRGVLGRGAEMESCARLQRRGQEM